MVPNLTGFAVEAGEKNRAASAATIKTSIVTIAGDPGTTSSGSEDT
jgi:hypothetical protein